MANRILVSTRKGLFALEPGPTGWRVATVAFLGENVTLSLADRAGGWYAALNLGHFGVKLKYTPDAGKTWEDRAAPAYPAEAMLTTGDGKPPQPATLKMLWSLANGGPNESGRVWAGTLPGGLFRSDDGGRTWDLVRGLWGRPERDHWLGGGYDTPGIHSICVDPRSPATLRIAISSGGVWQTDDTGATWRLTSTGMFADYMPPDRKFDPNIQDAHRMVQCANAPDHFWVQHHNGVFRSTDGAKTWEHVPAAAPSGFGFGVAVHPRDPLTAWFAPAVKDECRVPVEGKLVVSRTQDGGKTFTALRTGLPQIAAYDLIYRHALAVDETGHHLVIGSTTGGLWTSADGGETWQPIAERLPPVHAVEWC